MEKPVLAPVVKQNGGVQDLIGGSQNRRSVKRLFRILAYHSRQFDPHIALGIHSGNST